MDCPACKKPLYQDTDKVFWCGNDDCPQPCEWFECWMCQHLVNGDDMTLRRGDGLCNTHAEIERLGRTEYNRREEENLT